MRLPRKTTGYKSEEINEIIDYLQMNQLLPSSDHRVEQTTSGIFLHNITKPSGGGDFDYKRFRLDYTSTTKVTVQPGEVVVNSTTKTLAAAVEITGEGGGAIPIADNFTSEGVHYVYLQLIGDGSIDPMLVPDSVAVCCSKTHPAEASVRNVYSMVGEFEVELVNGNYLVKSGSVVRYFIGDRDFYNVVPDGETTPSLQYPIKTTEFRQVADGGYGELEMYNAHSADLASTSAWGTGIAGIPMLYKDANGGGTLDWYSVDTEDPLTPQESIEIVSGQVQIHDMNAAAAESGTAITGYQFGMRTTLAGSFTFATQQAVAEALADYFGTGGGITINHNLEYHSDYDSANPTEKAAGKVLACKDGTLWDWYNLDDIVLGSGETLDGRYWKHAAASGDPEAKDFTTTGDVQAEDIYATGILTAGTVMNVLSGGSYQYAANEGQDSQGAKVQIPLAGGGFIECYLRGGILTQT